MSRDAVDIFAGPGGWDLSAGQLGLRVLGIERDDAACATRAAAGLETLQADVAALDPCAFGPMAGVIGSPPCPTYSAAGQGAGRLLTAVIVGLMDDLAAGRDTREEGRADAQRVLEAAAGEDAKARERAPRDAAMSVLVIEPLRWVLALRPEWVALEQVPQVLPLWAHMGRLLEAHGYGVWTGVLEAERYGVPQTRERAILLAAKGRTPHPPIATHQRYVPGEPRWAEPSLTLEGEVLPWVSMADALAMPSGLVVRNGANSMKTSRDTQDMVPYERSVDAPSSTIRSNGYYTVAAEGEHPEPPMRWKEGPSPRPAPTVTGGGSMTGGPDPFASASARASANGAAIRMRANAQPNACVRAAGEPAPTITGGHDTTDRQWQATHYNQRQNGATPRPMGEPAPAMLAGGLAKGVPVWDDDECVPPQAGPNAARVTEDEAAVLQTFPWGYPWQGSRAKRYQQIGNAFPPLLALRVLEALLERKPMALEAPRAEADRNVPAMRNNTSANACERQADEPAGTLYFGGRMNGVYWVPPS